MRPSLFSRLVLFEAEVLGYKVGKSKAKLQGEREWHPEGCHRARGGASLEPEQKGGV